MDASKAASTIASNPVIRSLFMLSCANENVWPEQAGFSRDDIVGAIRTASSHSSESRDALRLASLRVFMDADDQTSLSWLSCLVESGVEPRDAAADTQWLPISEVACSDEVFSSWLSSGMLDDDSHFLCQILKKRPAVLLSEENAPLAVDAICEDSGMDTEFVSFLESVRDPAAMKSLVDSIDEAGRMEWLLDTVLGLATHRTAVFFLEQWVASGKRVDDSCAAGLCARAAGDPEALATLSFVFQNAALVTSSSGVWAPSAPDSKRPGDSEHTSMPWSGNGRKPASREMVVDAADLVEIWEAGCGSAPAAMAAARAALPAGAKPSRHASLLASMLSGRTPADEGLPALLDAMEMHSSLPRAAAKSKRIPSA